MLRVGHKRVFSSYPPRIRWEGGLERRHNGGSSRRPWRNNITALCQEDEMDLAILQREGMELQVWIYFVSPKWSLSEVQIKQKKIWETCRSEDIQVHQCWEVFPEVLLPSSEIRSSHVIYIGACCILSPNKLKYQFPWCHHMSSHWSLNCFIATGQRSLSRWSKLSVEILLLPAHLSPWPQRS